MNTSGPFRPLSWAEAIVRATTFFSKVWRSSSWSSATAARPCWHSGPGSYYQVAIGGHTETAGGNSGPLCETCHPVGGPGVPNHFPIGTTSASSRAGCPGHWSERNSGHGPPSSGAAAMPCAGTGEWPIDSSEPAPRLQVRSVMDAPYAGSTGSPTRQRTAARARELDPRRLQPSPLLQVSMVPVQLLLPWNGANGGAPCATRWAPLWRRPHPKRCPSTCLSA